MGQSKYSRVDQVKFSALADHIPSNFLKLSSTNLLVPLLNTLYHIEFNSFDTFYLIQKIRLMLSLGFSN